MTTPTNPIEQELEEILVDFSMEYANEDSNKTSDQVAGESVAALKQLIERELLELMPKDKGVNILDNESRGECIGYNKALAECRAVIKEFIGGEA